MGQDDLDSYAIIGARALCAKQAMDHVLWSPSQLLQVLELQKALRDLHRVIENDQQNPFENHPEDLVEAAVALVEELGRRHYDYDWVYEGIDRLRIALPKERL